jgi:hypothetical protein
VQQNFALDSAFAKSNPEGHAKKARSADAPGPETTKGASFLMHPL